jgi:hypothetical protein
MTKRWLVRALQIGNNPICEHPRQFDVSATMDHAEQPIPTGTWIQMNLPGFPTFIGFTYVDPEAGLSAKGGPQDDSDLAERPSMTLRLPMPGVASKALSREEIERLRLPKMPSWVEEFYGPQPEPGTQWGIWRQHPSLRGRFHPGCPDDLQVVVHDGGPRMSEHRGELVWVRVTGVEGEVFCARLLNQPHNLQSVRLGDTIQFLVPTGGKHPLMVTEKYLRERANWIVHPCRKCGLSELFDAPSDLISKIFPDIPADAELGMFTTFCPLCGGVQGAEPRGVNAEDAAPAREPEIPKKKWWAFWK